jgi:hypothetical protein
MPDIADLAQAQNERLDQMTLAVRKPAAPQATGFCLNCGEPLSDGRRWCDTDCRNDWQRMESDQRRVEE